MKNKSWVLFWGMFKIALFTFGGGYVVIPMMEKTFVDKGFFSKEELLDMASVAQSSPGAIAINLSALCAYRIDKIKGVCVALVASILPPLVLLSVISLSYDVLIQNRLITSALHGMEAAVVALIVDVLISMGQTIYKQKDMLLYLLLIGSFLLTFFTSVHPVYIISGSALICILAGKVRV